MSMGIMNTYTSIPTHVIYLTIIRSWLTINYDVFAVETWAFNDYSHHEY